MEKFRSMAKTFFKKGRIAKILKKVFAISLRVMRERLANASFLKRQGV
ncbi:MAG: hypothetical protein WC435_02140 [Candidatus Paceibacterota bacterium]